MERYITFKETDLKAAIASIEANVDHLEVWIDMAEEQRTKSRDNLTVGDFAQLSTKLENIRRILIGFKV